MKYKIAVCDDVEKDMWYIAAAVKRWAEKEKVSIEIETFFSAERLIDSCVVHFQN